MTDHGGRYLIPVEGLTITQDWEVGAVNLLGPGRAHELVDKYRLDRGGGAPIWFDTFVDKWTKDQLDPFTVAEVQCSEPHEAFEHIADALAILRLLQHLRNPTINTHLQPFGLPGQVAPPWRVGYIDLIGGPSLGYVAGDSIPGWTFSDDDYFALQADPGLQFVASAIAKPDRSRLERRALLGARLLSTSTLSHDPDQKLLNAAVAIEVLIGDDQKEGVKKFRLARRHAFLACSTATSARPPEPAALL